MLTQINPKWTTSKSELKHALKKNKEYLSLKKGEWQDPDFEPTIYKHSMDYKAANLKEKFKGTQAMKKVEAEYFKKPEMRIKSLQKFKKFKKMCIHKEETNKQSYSL